MGNLKLLAEMFLCYSERKGLILYCDLWLHFFTGFPIVWGCKKFENLLLTRVGINIVSAFLP